MLIGSTMPNPTRTLPLRLVRSAVMASLPMAALATSLLAIPAWADDADRLKKLEEENQALKNRLDSLEQVAQKEGILAGGTGSTNLVKSMSGMELSGFVTSSYFYDTSNPKSGTSPGYLWNRKSDSFAINKVKLTIASQPVERSGDTWGAAYRASLIFGQDAPIVNSSASTVGFSSLREAYVELNVPLGTGLNVKAGELISLLNYESGDGGAVNDNFSQGYQWFYTGNGPAAGAQLGYTFTDWLDVKVRLQNGLYAGPIDNNKSKTVMASIGVKPTDKVWLNFIGFTGRESDSLRILQGVSMLGGWNVTDKFHVGTELDYFVFNNSHKDHAVWSSGGWFSYAFTPKVGAAIRAEYLSDTDGVDASGDPLGFKPNSGQDISSVAFTFNLKPLPQVKIQPEIRYDHSSLSDAFGTKKDRFLVGAGVSYLF